MTASIGLLTDMIINSLDDEKVLKDKLQEKQLEYILGLLLEHNIITLSELFTFNNKEKIQHIIEQQIDHNRDINVTIKPKDKNEFSNIVMDVIQSKIQTQQHDQRNTFCFTNKMTTHEAPYQTASDQPSSFGYTSYKSQTPPNTQSSHPQPPICPITDHYNPPVTPPMSTNKQPPEPALHFDLENPFDDLISLKTFDSMPISQADMNNLSGANTPNTATMIAPSINTTNTTHKLLTTTPNMAIEELVNTTSPQTSQSNNNIVAESQLFAEKMKNAIASKTNNSTTPPANKTPKKKIYKIQTQPPTQPPVSYDEYDIYDNEQEDGVPLGGMDAPQITLNDEPATASYNQHNGYNGHQNDYSAPTPREWAFTWEQSPRATQARTPATSPPRIRDPMLIKNALEGVAYYADKLDSLHSEYRRVYSEQQQLYTQQQQLQQLQSDSMDPSEYQSVQHRYKMIEQSYYQMSLTL
eukprot:350692_1